MLNGIIRNSSLCLNLFLYFITLLILCRGNGFCTAHAINYFGILIIALITSVDMKTKKIPLFLNGIFVLTGIIKILLKTEKWQISIGGLFVGSILMCVLYCFSKEKGVGGGDVKFTAALGFFLGSNTILQSVLAGALFCCFINIVLTKKYKIYKEFPLTPYLGAGSCFIILLEKWRL